ncbi:MAG: hypothetical protein KDE31_18120, partial [Caldilineaceae bacterium]|nr:hypothetical protein [Caldilineaceae bacterium]
TNNMGLGDFNGDHKMDIVIIANIYELTTSQRTYWQSQGYGASDWFFVQILIDGDTVLNTVVAPIGPVGSSGMNSGLNHTNQATKFLIGDFNGDGRDDIFRSYVFLSTGTSIERQSWTNSAWGKVGDFNGDGLDDLFKLAGVNGSAAKLLLSTGDGFTVHATASPVLPGKTYPDKNWAEFEWAAPENSLGKWHAVEANGDGKTDFLQVEGLGSTTPIIYLQTSTGSGFSRTLPTVTAPTIQSPYEFPVDVFGLDLNGDKRTDVVESRKEPSHYYTIYGNTLTPIHQPTMHSWSWGVPIVYPGDYNGDGKYDLPYEAGYTTNLTNTSPCTACVIAYTDSVVPDLMKTHTFSMGGSAAIQYLPSSYWDNTELPMVVQTVTKVTINDGRGNSSETKYSYEGGAYDPFERRFLGFEKVTAELACESYETSCPWVISHYRQEPVAAGSVSKSEIFAGNGTLMRRIENGYVVNAASVPFTAHKTSEQITDFYTGGSATKRKEWTYDGYANLLLEKDLGVTGTNTDDLITTTSYQLNLTDYLVNYPSHVTKANASLQVLRDREYVYDGATSASTEPTEGHATKIRDWLDSENRWVEKTRSFDSYGNMTVEIDAEGNRTERDYDTLFHQFPIEERNPLY